MISPASIDDIPPLHPRQKMQQLIERIQINDSKLKVVSIRDRSEELRANNGEALTSLGQALARNTHIVELDLTNAIPFYAGDIYSCRRRCYCQQKDYDENDDDDDDCDHVNDNNVSKSQRHKKSTSVSSLLSGMFETIDTATAAIRTTVTAITTISTPTIGYTSSSSSSSAAATSLTTRQQQYNAQCSSARRR